MEESESALDALAGQDRTIQQLRFRLRDITSEDRRHSFDRAHAFVHSPANHLAIPAGERPPVLPFSDTLVPAAPPRAPPPWAAAQQLGPRTAARRPPQKRLRAKAYSSDSGERQMSPKYTPRGQSLHTLTPRPVYSKGSRQTIGCL